MHRAVLSQRTDEGNAALGAIIGSRRARSAEHIERPMPTTVQRFSPTFRRRLARGWTCGGLPVRMEQPVWGAVMIQFEDVGVIFAPLELFSGMLGKQVYAVSHCDSAVQ